jgi:tRNA1Val (adenine37-N6)-methyltransferase
VHRHGQAGNIVLDLKLRTTEKTSNFKPQTFISLPNTYFQFKQFTIQQDRCAMKVTTDACLFGSLCISLSKNLQAKNILDIGAGTGLLALMYAQENPQAIIDAIETDENSARQAKENVSQSPWSDRIQIIHADARHFSFPEKYDLIISNPPFYENELKSPDKRKNIALHGDDLSFSELPDVIKKNLKPDGRYCLLLPSKRKQEVSRLLKKNFLHVTNIVSVRQSLNHDFFRIILSGKHDEKKAEEIQEEEISVWNETKQYSPEFKKLLKDFYLNL